MDIFQIAKRNPDFYEIIECNCANKPLRKNNCLYCQNGYLLGHKKDNIYTQTKKLILKLKVKSPILTKKIYCSGVKNNLSLALVY